MLSVRYLLGVILDFAGDIAPARCLEPSRRLAGVVGECLGIRLLALGPLQKLVALDLNLGLVEVGGRGVQREGAEALGPDVGRIVDAQRTRLHNPVSAASSVVMTAASATSLAWLSCSALPRLSTSKISGRISVLISGIVQVNWMIGNRTTATSATASPQAENHSG